MRRARALSRDNFVITGPRAAERKRPMQRGANLVKEKHAKTSVALIFTALLLALGVLLGSAGSDLAGAQEKAPGGVPEAGASGAPPQGAAAGDDPSTQLPEVAVQSWALMDAETGLYLNGENPDEQLPIGSVTKIMTALVVLEEEPNLDEEVTVSEEAESYVGSVYSNVGPGRACGRRKRGELRGDDERQSCLARSGEHQFRDPRRVGYQRELLQRSGPRRANTRGARVPSVRRIGGHSGYHHQHPE